jgi:hypothetical protein
MYSPLRQATVLVVRAAGIVFLGWGLLSLPEVVQAGAAALRAGHYGADYLISGSGLQTALAALARIAIALALCLGSGRLTYWLVPSPGVRCLRCGHDLAGATDGVCPECGANPA